MPTSTVKETQSKTATLSYEGGSLEMPVTRGSEGETAIDVAQLRAKTGMITIDPGYAIEELAENSTFLEVAWLLLHGELPSASQLTEFKDEIRHHTLLHENFKRFFEALPKDAHPMPVCSAAVGALTIFYEDAATE